MSDEYPELTAAYKETEEKLKELRRSIMGPIFPSLPVTNEFIYHYYQVGEKIAKLDAVVTSIEIKSNALFATIGFINSGQKDITIASPSTWNGRWDPTRDNSWIRIEGEADAFKTSHDKSDYLYTDFLGASELFNKSNYSGDTILVKAGQTKYVNFLFYPRHAIRQGEYNIYALITFNVIAPEELKGNVEFRSPTARITIHRDYPMFPDEVKAFNAYMAKDGAQIQ
jgi:hypothetical protein